MAKVFLLVKNVFCGAAFVSALAAACLAGPAHAQPSARKETAIQQAASQTSQSATLRVSMELKNNRILLGEPVALRYGITTSAGQVSLPFEQKQAWLHVELRDSNGKIVCATDLTSVRGTHVIERQTRYNQQQQGEEFSLVSYRSFEDALLLGGQRLPVPDAGKYQVVVHTTSLWSAVPGTFERGRGRRGKIYVRDASGKFVAADKSTEEPSTPVIPEWAEAVSSRGQWDKEYKIDQTFLLPLTVERKTADFANKAQTLAAQIAEGGAYSARTAVQELFSLYGKSAEKAQWELAGMLALRPDPMPLTLLLREVARLNTPEAIDFVAACLWNRNYPRKPRATGELVTVFYYADRDIQNRILKQFAQHGKRLPNVPVLD